ncbi:MAG: sigma-70 family RNA polymerase sigma factor [Kofleriaceae bacterium]
MEGRAAELANRFVELAAEAAADDRVALGEALVATLAAVRERWPAIQVDDDLVVAELAAQWTPAAAEGEPLPRCAADLALARICLRGDLAAQRYFNDQMFDRVDRVLSRLGVVGADSDDVKQEVRSKLLIGHGGEPKLALFQGTGPLVHWVASVAGREALSMMRRRKITESVGEDDLLDVADDPQLMTLKAAHSSEFKRAFQDAVAALEPRDRAILRALIVDDRTVNEVAAVYGIHRVTASRWVAEIRKALLDGTKRRLRQTLKLDPGSLESAIRWIDSNLDVSLYRLLADPGLEPP